MILEKSLSDIFNMLIGKHVYVNKNGIGLNNCIYSDTGTIVSMSPSIYKNTVKYKISLDSKIPNRRHKDYIELSASEIIKLQYTKRLTHSDIKQNNGNFSLIEIIDK